MKTAEISVREGMVIDKVKDMMRLHDHEFIRNNKTTGVSVCMGGNTIYMELDSPNKIVRFVVE